MDNNLSNGSGIPNVNDIKFDDTPAEYFDNLYGNQVNNVGSIPNSINQVNVQSQPVAPNPGIVNQQPVQSVNNVGFQGQSSVNPQVVQPVVNPVSVDPTVMPSTNSVTMENSVGVTSNTGMVNPQPVEPINNPSMTQQTVQPSGVVNSVNNVGVQVNPGFASNMNQEPMMTSNPVNVTSNGADISNVDIDAQRMQSIEEQLSKTSQYNPEDLQQEKITIPTDNQYEKNKSGLAFVIVLFIILAVVIVFLPQITKLIK